MRGVTLIAAALALAAPAAGTTGTGAGLYGKVTRGPLTPVCVAERPCSGPAAGAMLQFVRKGVVVARVVTAKDGTYRIALRAGSYLVRIAPVSRVGPGVEPKAVRVATRRWSRQNFSIDTGIR